MPESTWLTIHQVATWLEISEHTIRDLIKRGELSGYRFGNRLRFTREQVEAYIDSTEAQLAHSPVPPPPKLLQRGRIPNPHC